jgi:hypothetical protein
MKLEGQQMDEWPPNVSGFVVCRTHPRVIRESRDELYKFLCRWCITAAKLVTGLLEIDGWTEACSHYELGLQLGRSDDIG